jgi:hypothetical protein
VCCHPYNHCAIMVGGNAWFSLKFKFIKGCFSFMGAVEGESCGLAFKKHYSHLSVSLSML